MSGDQWSWCVSVQDFEEGWRTRCMGRWSNCGVIHPRDSITITRLVTIAPGPSRYGHLNYTYVIETSFSFTLIIIDMKRTNKKNKVYKSKKPYDRRSMHEPQVGPSTSTSTSTSATDLMPYIPPACDLDATSSSSAQVTAGGSVSLPFASLSIDSLLSSRPPITSKSLPRFPFWR